MDWPFRIASEAAFAGDLNGFCAAEGYPPLSADGQTVLSCDFVGLLRFDFDIFDITIPATYAAGNEPSPSNPDPTPLTAAVDRGLHVNARATALPNADPVAAQAALTALTTQLAAFFAALPTMTNTIPAQFGGGTQTWHATPNGTVLIDPAPSVPKRVWA